MSSNSPDSRRGGFIRAIRRHPSMIVAVAALAFAMVGTAAATQVDGGQTSAKKKAKKGPRGPAGPAGPAGAQGPAGFTGRVEVNGSAPYDSTTPKHAEASCPAGKVVIGGGAITASDTASTPVALKHNGVTSPGSTTWYADAYETTATGESWNIQISLYCANPAP